MENKSISTTLNISNSDIVTMLIAEKKEQVASQVFDLKIKKNELIFPYLNKVSEEIKKFKESKEYLLFKQQLYDFCKIYNPDIELEIRERYDFEFQALSITNSNYCINNKYFKIGNLTIECVNEDDQGKFSWPFREEIMFPDHLDVKFPLNMPEDEIEQYNDIVNKISNLESSVRNTDRLKEEMIAAMTKTAIMNNPELLAMRNSVLQISK